MNTLSWLIYAAEVLSSVKVFTAHIGITCLIFGIISLAISGVSAGMGWADRDDEALRFSAVASKWTRTIFSIGAVAGLIWTASPSANTIYMIAASEAGEAVVTSPEAVEMMGDLKEIIKKRLKAELGE